MKKKVKKAQIQQSDEDSNSLFSHSNILPLLKREETNKKKQQPILNIKNKISNIEYQLVQQLSIITPLQIHPLRIIQQIQSFYYIRKIVPFLQSQRLKRQQKQIHDFTITLVSLFQKGWINFKNKFVIVLPKGGILYFFHDNLDCAYVLVSTGIHYQFQKQFEKQSINFLLFPKQQQKQKQKLLIEGYNIKLLFGYILNLFINQTVSIQIYSNYPFDFCVSSLPLYKKFIQNRQQKQFLAYKQKNVIEVSQPRLYHIRLQSYWFKQDVAKINEILQIQNKQFQKYNQQQIYHDIQISLLKYTNQLTNRNICRAKPKMLYN